MKTFRLIDLLKLAPMMLAATLLVGCGTPEDGTVEPADDAMGVDSSSDLGEVEETDAVVIEEPMEPAVEPAVDVEPVVETETP